MDTGEIPDLLLPPLLIQWPLALNLVSIWNRHCLTSFSWRCEVAKQEKKRDPSLGRSIKSQSQNNSLITCLKLWTEAKIKNNIIFPIFDVFFYILPPTHNKPGTHVLTYLLPLIRQIFRWAMGNFCTTTPTTSSSASILDGGLCQKLPPYHSSGTIVIPCQNFCLSAFILQEDVDCLSQTI